jgi:hypothetical protein
MWSKHVVVVVYFMQLNIVYRRKTQTSNRVTQYGAEIPDSYVTHIEAVSFKGIRFKIVNGSTILKWIPLKLKWHIEAVTFKGIHFKIVGGSIILKWIPLKLT